MTTIAWILGLVISVAIAVILIMAIGPVRRGVGFGNVEPSGAAAAVAGIGGK